LAALLGPTAAADNNDAPPLTFVVSSANSAPLEITANGESSGGVIHDVSVELARRLGRQARFVTTSRKRIEDDLRVGRADALCYATPQWINAPLSWTIPFIPNGEVIVMRQEAPAIKSLSDLRGKTLGAVLGYAYPQLQLAGGGITRDDAPSMQVNIRKLLTGRTQYAIVDSLSLAYEARTNSELTKMPTFATSQFKAQCGFATRLNIPTKQINDAVAGMERDRTLDRILARYR
jgi:polar amino acid transport system substrate-binding protein